MNRRNFLKGMSGMAGILATGIAPAVVSSPMKIWVPPTKIILPSNHEEVIYVDAESLPGGDGTREKPFNSWQEGYDSLPAVIQRHTTIHILGGTYSAISDNN